VAIPAEIRERFGLLPETEVEFVVKKGEVVVRKAPLAGARGQRLVQRMRGTATVRMTTDAILSLTRARAAARIRPRA
jgi:AbrB family looped-hinge helix DNA binding protein